MSSTTIVYRTSKTNKEGKSPLYIRIIRNRKTQFISLGIHLLPEEWDEKKLRVKSKHPNSGRLNSYIAQKLAEAHDTALTLLSKDRNTSSLRIKEKIKGRSSGSFTDYFNKYRDWLLANDKIGTYIKVKSSISKLNQFTNDRNLQFEDIDIEFLKKFETYLAVTLENQVNTIHSTIKIIRKLFNEASREGIIEFTQNPFLRYKLRTEKTTKTYLTEEEVLNIEKVDVKPGTRLEHHKDIFLLACDAGGIRVSDLLQLKWSDFNGTHLSIITQKTREHISVPLSKKALAIIKKYELTRRTEKYIFPLLNVSDDPSALELNKAVSSATAYLNKDLQTVAELAEIDKHISMHTSRHTWATRALRKGMRIEYVSKLLGHASIKTTQVYAKVVNAELDKAMEVFNE